VRLIRANEFWFRGAPRESWRLNLQPSFKGISRRRGELALCSPLVSRLVGKPASNAPSVTAVAAHVADVCMNRRRETSLVLMPDTPSRAGARTDQHQSS